MLGALVLVLVLVLALWCWCWFLRFSIRWCWCSAVCYTWCSGAGAGAGVGSCALFHSLLLVLVSTWCWFFSSELLTLSVEFCVVDFSTLEFAHLSLTSQLFRGVLTPIHDLRFGLIAQHLGLLRFLHLWNLNPFSLCRHFSTGSTHASTNCSSIGYWLFLKLVSFSTGCFSSFFTQLVDSRIV